MCVQFEPKAGIFYVFIFALPGIHEPYPLLFKINARGFFFLSEEPIAKNLIVKFWLRFKLRHFFFTGTLSKLFA